MKFPEQYRDTTDPTFATIAGQPFGHFVFFVDAKRRFQCHVIASSGDELVQWEHVSVRVMNEQGKNFTPPWDLMCAVKDMFWDEEETVMQLHPPKSQYVNTHPNVLHLWRHKFFQIPIPPKELV